MPYEIRENCVYKQGSDTPLKCYDNHKDALDYLRALEANVPDAKELPETAEKVMRILDQQEVHYTPVSTTPGKACSSCMWWRGDSCHIVASYPEVIVPNGYCDEHRVATPLTLADVAPIPVVIVDPEPVVTDEQEMALPTTRKGFMDAVVEALKSIFNPDEPAFSVFKASNGKHYWIARHTGKFKDREDEIIANHAHDEYVARAQAGKVPMPELWVWHKAGSRHGQADMIWKSGGFTLALGHFDDTPEAEKAIVFYQKNRGKIKLSHMFHYPKHAKQGRVYHAYNTVEITTLPDGAEAFPYTSFEELDMSLTDTQRAFIREIGGDDMVKRVESADTKALADTKKLEALGVEHKGLDDFEGSTVPENKDFEALKAAQGGFETRLKAVEEYPTAVQSTLKALNQQITDLQQANANALQKANALEKKLLEYEAVAPPSSQSKDALLNEREKSLIQDVMAAAKAEGSPSLVQRVAGSEAVTVTTTQPS